MTATDLFWMTLAALAGFAAGAAHFATLSPIARMLAEGRVIAVGLQTARLVLLGLFLWFVARHGATILLAAAGGLMAGRAAVLRRRPE